VWVRERRPTFVAPPALLYLDLELGLRPIVDDRDVAPRTGIADVDRRHPWLLRPAGRH